MIIVRIVQVQFLLLLIFLFCTSVAGEKDAALWYCVITLILGTLAVARMIARSRR